MGVGEMQVSFSIIIIWIMKHKVSQSKYLETIICEHQQYNSKTIKSNIR